MNVTMNGYFNEIFNRLIFHCVKRDDTTEKVGSTQ